MSVLETERLRIVPATVEMVEADLSGAGNLATALATEQPPDWPPEHHDSNALRYTLEALGKPGAAGWWLHYFVAIEGTRDTLVGVGGYKGPPDEGVVEVGYSVVTTAQRRGYATEAVGALVESAWERKAETIRAETLPSLTASIRVLEKLGFESAEAPGEPGVIAFALSRPA